MSQPPSYVLPRDYLDNVRLNLHHYLCVELFGYHTHPAIPISNTKLRVADIGTGTGVWLTDLARRLPPSVQLDGFDISLEALPPKEWLPANLRTTIWDVKTEVPDELVGVYDIVHISHFVFVLLDEEVQPVLDKVMRLLKPGGYLQWSEVDMGSFRIETTTSPATTTALERLFRLSEGHDPRLRPRWVPHLGSKLAAAGYQAITSDVRDAPGDLALALHDCNLMINASFARRFAVTEPVAQTLAQLMLEVERETREGACWAFTRYTVVGRKPGAAGQRCAI
ncbi:S-adenosyl-L-methionine-dependent methyltransferase [Aspergillus uvarum CBS 121591]|uniref:S-adenosyl-L-methionine-dependent methyltransferase n=1 Tax=Aspergillus uvarum CBS 121591 TaxID=1448315 RepID=A0A319CPI2_9EURO|nr:S-adenosyl-L-methionine-dependent methyltransferase [Aspergillus uvarum CBS 121591]PYH86329.1 S-adenosyl-L-methionine-dependent methyltransferase [Aspergillus uvarum CBS 121591]